MVDQSCSFFARSVDTTLLSSVGKQLYLSSLMSLPIDNKNDIL